MVFYQESTFTKLHNLKNSMDNYRLMVSPIKADSLPLYNEPKGKPIDHTALQHARGTPRILNALVFAAAGLTSQDTLT